LAASKAHYEHTPTVPVVGSGFTIRATGCNDLLQMPIQPALLTSFAKRYAVNAVVEEAFSLWLGTPKNI
jgi:hypothetical protein